MENDKRKTPRLCDKCGMTHFAVSACNSEAAIRTHRKAQPVTVIEHPERRGLRPFGDRLETIQMQGTTVMLKDFKIRKRGGVIPHPDWPKEAA